jgi:ABC-type sugar transport system permease subunit
MQPQPPANGSPAIKLAGWALLVPAVVLTVLTLVIPTVRTVVASFHSENLLPGSPSENVGTENYGSMPGFSQSVWFALSLVTVPMIVAVVVAPLVAAALDWAGAWARWTARIVLSLSIVVFSPVAMSIAWQRDIQDSDPTRLASILDAGNAIRVATGMMTFGVVLAVGLMIFLPVFRAREHRQPMWGALFATAAVAVLGIVAIGLQQFTVPFLLTHFGPKNATNTPVGLMFTSSFQQMRLGVGAAVATVLLIILAVLGIAAMLVVILSRLRVSLVPLRRQPSDVPRPLNPGAIVLAALVLAAVLTAVVLNALPWLDALSGTDLPEGASGTAGRTWGPAITGAVASVGVAYLAALGISGLRPLGRHSEWLLMAFAPWLFVGVAPLSIQFFKSVHEDGDLDTRGALTPPILISVVALVIIAVLCRGQSEQWQRQVAAGAPAGSAFFVTVVLPTLPLAGLLFVVGIFFNAQDLLWPVLVAASPENDTAVLALFRLSSAGFGRSDFSVASATPLLAVVLGALAVIAVQVPHLDRMVATTGASRRETVRPTEHSVPVG